MRKAHSIYPIYPNNKHMSMITRSDHYIIGTIGQKKKQFRTKNRHLNVIFSKCLVNTFFPKFG